MRKYIGKILEFIFNGILYKKRVLDIGANLTDLMYTGIYNTSKKHENDLENVLQRSWNSGLEKIIVTGGNYEESNKALELANMDGKILSGTLEPRFGGVTCYRCTCCD